MVTAGLQLAKSACELRSDTVIVLESHGHGELWPICFTVSVASWTVIGFRCSSSGVDIRRSTGVDRSKFKPSTCNSMLFGARPLAGLTMGNSNLISVSSGMSSTTLMIRDPGVFDQGSEVLRYVMLLYAPWPYSVMRSEPSGVHVSVRPLTVREMSQSLNKGTVDCSLIWITFSQQGAAVDC